jgi:hypothetical protein
MIQFHAARAAKCSRLFPMVSKTCRQLHAARTRHGWELFPAVAGGLFERLPRQIDAAWLRRFLITAPQILFLGVPALGDNVTWPPERHSQERSRQPRLSETPFSLSCPAKRKGQAMVINPALTTAYHGVHPRGTRSLRQRFAGLLRSCSCNRTRGMSCVAVDLGEMKGKGFKSSASPQRLPCGSFATRSNRSLL